MAKYNRYILTCIEDYCPKDLISRLNDEEIEYWAFLEVSVDYKGVSCKVYEIYLETKNIVDYKYLEIILATRIDMDLCSYIVPISSREEVLNFFQKRSELDLNVILRCKV
jgi:hypothetical protein